MKKIIAVSLALVLMLSLAACTSKTTDTDAEAETKTDASQETVPEVTDEAAKEETEAKTETETEKKDAEGSAAAVANPVAESSLEEIKKLDKINIEMPEAASDVAVTRINGELDSIDLTVDGSKFNYRIKETAALEDISGLFYEWGDPTDTKAPENGPKCYVNDAGQGIIIWFRDGHSFSVSMSEKADSELLEMMYDLMNGVTEIE